MFVNFLSVSVIFAIIIVVRCETTKETLKDVTQRSTLKSNSDYVPTSDTWDGNPNLNSMWVYRPSTHSLNEQENEFHRVSLRAPFGLTRLTKPLTFGFDPYFNKEYFEPFERRQRPVTLVGFRKNGFQPRSVKKMEESKLSEPAELAEMQSPFNEVSSYWQDEPGLVNE